MTCFLAKGGGGAACLLHKRGRGPFGCAACLPGKSGMKSGMRVGPELECSLPPGRHSPGVQKASRARGGGSAASWARVGEEDMGVSDKWGKKGDMSPSGGGGGGREACQCTDVGWLFLSSAERESCDDVWWWWVGWGVQPCASRSVALAATSLTHATALGPLHMHILGPLLMMPPSAVKASYELRKMVVSCVIRSAALRLAVTARQRNVVQSALTTCQIRYHSQCGIIVALDSSEP